ncbi:MAG: T9SS type A sorting domain-containing protein [Candidatus Marinimicrobia bacterium]|nr:T9SS type A sorting domain-containing protein [Candidatus Neomarinimicrobiota bacterium]
MVAALTADPNASGGYIWATGPGLPLSVEGQITRVVLLNMTFVSWNGGDVTASDWPTGVIMMPETGSVFRMVTTKPNTANDVFTFSTSTLKTGTAVYNPKTINVWPNPYFGFNPEERTPLERKMVFTHLPETGKATIRIFNLAGELVKKLEHSDGTQFETWDLTNNFDIPVGSGMYIVHIETDKGDKVLKLAVIKPEERLDVY